MTYRHHGCHRHPVVSIVTVIEAPDPFVQVEDLNTRLRLDLSFDSPMSDEDQETAADVTAMIGAAISSLDGPSGSLGRALGPQLLELATEGRGQREITLRFPPIISIVSIVYRDSAGADQTLDPSLYRLRRGAVAFTNGAPHSDDLRIRCRAGYATADSPAVEAVPLAIKQAVKLMVGDMWAFRESAAESRTASIPSSAAVERLIRPFKVYAV